MPIPVICQLPSAFDPLVVADTCLSPSQWLNARESCRVKCADGANALSGDPTYSCDTVTGLSKATLTCGK